MDEKVYKRIQLTKDDVIGPAYIPELDRVKLPEDFHVKSNEFGKHFIFEPKTNILCDGLNNYIYSVQKSIYTHVAEEYDNAVFEAICNTAREAGFTDAYILNKEFIITAIQNELNRRQKG